MKKIVFSIFIGIFAFTTFAIDFNASSKEAFEASVEKTKNSKAYSLAKLQFDFAISLGRKMYGKTSSDITFKEFIELAKSEAKILDGSNSTDEKTKENFVYSLISQIYRGKRFMKAWEADYFADPKCKYSEYAMRWFLTLPALKHNYTDAERLAMFNEYLKGTKGRQNHWKQIFWLTHKEMINNMPATDALNELKEIKRRVFPKIDEAPEWKKLAVEIELMIKALQ